MKVSNLTGCIEFSNNFERAICFSSIKYDIMMEPISFVLKFDITMEQTGFVCLYQIKILRF